MAEQDDGQDRTEQPSEKRLNDAKEKGDIPRSRDLNAAIIVFAGIGTLLALRPWVAQHLEQLLHLGLSYDRDQVLDPVSMLNQIAVAVITGIKLLAPLFGVTLLATLFAPVLGGGFNFSTKALEPKPERLNPIEGIKRLVSLRGLVELGKSLLKVILIGSVLASVLWNARDQLLASGHANVQGGIAIVVTVISKAVLMFAGVLALVGLLDTLWQRFDYTRRMRMTKQELRDEYKETEGSPELKGHIRQMQQQVAQRRMMDAIPAASAVVMNPTHFAVAIKYDEGMRAPRVVAKGLDLLALRIRDVAIENNVPLITAPPLARALYHNTKLEQEIPGALYVAVAQVLAYVYRLREAEYASDMPPPPNPDIDPQLLGPYQMPAKE